MERLRIKQVAQETGLSEQVIRKWEQRYRAIEPERLENGYRIYSRGDVEALLEIKLMVEEGVAVSRAAELVQERHRKAKGVRTAEDFSKASATADAGTSPLRASLLMQAHYDEVVNGLLLAVEDGQLHNLTAQLQTAFATYGLQSLIDYIILPFLRIVGDKWQNGEWTEDLEHLSTLMIRDFVTRKMAEFPENNASDKRVLLSCVPGERHDIMLLLAGLQARRLGWGIAFLGPSPAPEALVAAVIHLSPAAVLLSISTCAPLNTKEPDLNYWLNMLNQFALKDRSRKYYLGGPDNVIRACTDTRRGLRPVRSLAEFIDALNTPRPLAYPR